MIIRFLVITPLFIDINTNTKLMIISIVLV